MHDKLTERIIGAAIAVHRELGPGLLESTYEECLAIELADVGIQFTRQEFMPLSYKGHEVLKAYRCDMIVEGQVILELKTVETIAKIHIAQVMTYLKLSKLPTGLLINFDSIPLKNGIHRISFNGSVSRESRGQIAESN